MNSDLRNACHDCHEVLDLPRSEGWKEISKKGYITYFQLCKRCYDKRIRRKKVVQFVKRSWKDFVIIFLIILSAVLMMTGSFGSGK